MQIELKRKNVRYYRISVDKSGKITVTAPVYATNSSIDELIAKKTPWINKRIAEFVRQNQAKSNQKGILYQGELFDFELNPKCKKTEIDFNNGIIYSNKNLLDQNVLTSWYKAEAKTVILSRLNVINKIVGNEFQNVYIRSQKTKWGTCSGKGNLSFNYKLVKAPCAVLDYVIIHELCHLKNMTHNREFYRTVAIFCPDYKTQMLWLKRNGLTL